MAPKSPDLNPVDYAAWGLCNRPCIALRFPAWTILKDRVCTCWENLDQELIDKFIEHWRDKLNAVVRLNDGHIGQLF